MSWHHRARCAGDPTAVALTAGMTRRAQRSYCHRCPVMELCLAHALVEELGLPLDHRVGTRGGFSPTERLALELEHGPAGLHRNLEEAQALDNAGTVHVPSVGCQLAEAS